MLNLEQLQQLVAVAQAGTVTQAAQDLLISQPALTRSLQRLEDSLGVNLFDRQKNRIQLNDVGHYTVAQAQTLLEAAETFIHQVQHQAQKLETIFCGIVAPGIEYEIQARLADQSNPPQVEFILSSEAEILDRLLDQDYQVVFTNQPVTDDRVVSQPFFKEQLNLALLPTHPDAQKDQLELEDLAGLSVLVLSELGSWEKFLDECPRTHFIRQENTESFASLTTASSLPYFTTNITLDRSGSDPHRVHVPIASPAATQTFYVNVLKPNKRLIRYFQ